MPDLLIRGSELGGRSERIAGARVAVEARMSAAGDLDSDPVPGGESVRDRPQLKINNADLLLINFTMINFTMIKDREDLSLIDAAHHVLAMSG